MDDTCLNFSSTINNIIDNIILMYYYDNTLDISIDINSGQRMVYKLDPKFVDITFNNIINKYNNYILINIYTPNDTNKLNIKKVLYNINKIKNIVKINEKTLQINCNQNIIMTHSFDNPKDLLNFELKLNFKS